MKTQINKWELEQWLLRFSIKGKHFENLKASDFAKEIKKFYEENEDLIIQTITKNEKRNQKKNNNVTRKNGSN